MMWEVKCPDCGEQYRSEDMPTSAPCPMCGCPPERLEQEQVS